MVKAYKEFWKRYFDFGGKSSVGDYWWVVLCNILIGLVLGAAALVIRPVTYVTYVYELAAFIPGLAILVRRLRDGGNSILSLLWLLLPVIGWIILIIKLVK